MRKKIAAYVIGLLVAMAAGQTMRAADVLPVRKVFVVYDTAGVDTNARSSDRTAPDPDKEFRKEKLIAAILAFPIPFGFSGLHRIYLGSEPWIPVVYLVTGGGGLGLIPLIDFFFIVTADKEEFKKYENNPKFFMWVD
ncbi:MAG TPA: NINE protein [Bacteroidia bacterium]|nr:NINE protein [Bacteroidia bacterium]